MREDISSIHSVISDMKDNVQLAIAHVRSGPTSHVFVDVEKRR